MGVSRKRLSATSGSIDKKQGQVRKMSVHHLWSWWGLAIVNEII
jgi:hypothetical protein